MKKKQSPIHDDNYLHLVRDLEPVLSKYDRNTEELQESQVNDLSDLENEFRRLLVRHPRGLDAYRQFLKDCKNILSGRVYFRERDTTFKAFISPALKAKDPLALTRFHINWQFVKYILSLGWWSNTQQGRKLLKTAAKIKQLRNELIEINLPLALSQSRTFSSRNSQSHLTLCDFAQISSIGLVQAVDKFCGPYTRAFRSVCCGRSAGEMIESNSACSVHFYPQQKKTLYRVRKLLRQMPQDGTVDFDLVHKKLNEMELSVEDPLTAKDDMLNILAASTLIFASTMPHDDSSHDTDESTPGIIERHPDCPEDRPDAHAENSETIDTVRHAISCLPLYQRKLVAMMGVDFC